jgi:hypothetical protein
VFAWFMIAKLVNITRNPESTVAFGHVSK